MPDQIYAAIDLETTGLKAGRDEIIEVGIVRCTPDEVLDTFTSLVRPLEMPGLRVQRLTGIDLDELAAAPQWHEVEEQVKELLDGATLIGHNIDFDLNFLREAGISLSTPAVDTLELARIVDPLAPRHRLSDLCERYGITGGEAHRALSDAEAARQVFLELRERFDDLPHPARTDLAQIVAGSDFFWSVGRVLREWEQSSPRSAQANVLMRQIVGPGGEPTRAGLPDGSLVQLTERAFALIEEDGFERREEQLAMARDVANSLQHGGTLLIEAGTGTGKSLAYLVPAALWALKVGRTVLISTNTINLQQQLAGNDVELTRRLIAGVAPEAATALSATVVKGRGNYLCQDCLDGEVEAAGNRGDPSLLARVAIWRHLSPAGDRAELRLPPDQAKLWSSFSADGKLCFSDESCTYTNGTRAGECFLQQVERQAKRSHIVITNHALLVTSIIRSSMLIPDAPVVIIDEAHTLEKVATDQLSLEMNEAWLMEAVTAVSKEFDRLAERSSSQDLQKLSLELQAAADRLELSLADIFDRVSEFVARYRVERGTREDRVTLTAGVRNSEEWAALEELWERSISELSQLTTMTLDTLEEESSSADSEEPSPARALDTGKLWLTILRDRMTQMNDVISTHSDATVAWVERENRRLELTGLHSSPLNVAEALGPLWERKHATILTGATLATSDEPGREFSYLRDRLGIEDQDEALYDSPFDYEHHAKVFLPLEAPDGNDSNHNDFVADAVKQLAIAANGRTMVLFRSYDAMGYVVKQIEDSLEAHGLQVLRQGRESPTRIVEALLADHRSVAFGVAALWTGVDVPGEALSQLIVTKLPFDPPNDPVLKARSEQYPNSFRDFALPNAVIQYRQGVGRLIRSSTDKGVIVVLDGRVLRRDYGVVFRRALPREPQYLPLMQVVAEVKRFLPPPERAP